MEGQGTNLDKWLQLEGEVHSLRKDLGEIRTENAQTSAKINALGEGLRAQMEAITDLGQKLDEQRTRRPDLIALGSVLILCGGVGWTLITSWLDPLRARMDRVETKIEKTADSRWTAQDHYRWEAREDQIEIESRRETNQQLQMLSERILDIERDMR